MTNVVLTPNQTRTTCPEDPGELPKIICGYRNTTTGEVNITQGICVKVKLLKVYFLKYFIDSEGTGTRNTRELTHI